MNTERQRSEYQASEQLTGTYAEREALRKQFKAIAPAPKREAARALKTRTPWQAFGEALRAFGRF